MNPNQFPAQFGQYILLDRLNAGGMAEVFRAKVTGVEGFVRLVAIKCMLPQLAFDDQFTAMFIDEARLAAQLSHPNVVQIYELGRQAERLYIAMELIQGRDLRHILRTAKEAGMALPPSFSAYVISRAAHGLDYAHRRLGLDGQPLGLVHRDVSPQNILVTYDGEVKVVDFGIAKASAEARNSATQAGVLKGKFAYMAPEQVSGEAVDRRADIFALGSVLFEIVTGSRLFAGDNDLSVLEKVRTAAVPDLSALLAPDASPLRDVMYRALAQKLEDRYAFASEMAEELEGHLIEDRSIFGAKRAAQVMRSLYAEEITQVQELLRGYSDVTSANCVSVLAPSSSKSAEHVFESSFTPPGKTRLPEIYDNRLSGAEVRPTYQAADISHGKNLRSVLLTKQGRGPETGMRTRPRIQRAPPTEPVGDAKTNPTLFEEEPTEAVPLRRGRRQTLVDDVPQATHAGRILRRVGVVALVSLGAMTAVILFLQPRTGLPISLPMVAQALSSGKSFLGERMGVAKTNVQATVFGAQPPASSDGAPQTKDAPLYGLGFYNLKVEGSQAAAVSIDGRDQGAAPLQAHRLSFGDHEVRVYFPRTGRTSPRQQTFHITVTPEHTRVSPLTTVVKRK